MMTSTLNCGNAGDDGVWLLDAGRSFTPDVSELLKRSLGRGTRAHVMSSLFREMFSPQSKTVSA